MESRFGLIFRRNLSDESWGAQSAERNDTMKTTNTTKAAAAVAAQRALVAPKKATSTKTAEASPFQGR
jgi:hypothetical protein